MFGTTSTGKICAQIAEQMEADGHEVKAAFGRWGAVPEKFERFAHYFGSDIETKIHGMQTRLFDMQGLGSKRTTKSFVEWAENYDPSMLWIHNIHGYYINYPILFQWIKSRPQMKVFWTLHDCWAFTGHCVYFTMAGCERWKTGCFNCPQRKEYPASLFFDNSRLNYQKKKESFCSVRNLTLITPSRWLADLTRDSFLKEYPVKVIYNTIDRSVFKPTPSDFKKKYGIENNKIVLGVSNAWQEPRKGLKDFLQLAKILDDEYVIVLVGANEKIIKKLPKNIIGLVKTDSAQELAGIYSCADVLFNPTYEDNYPTVNIEAEACGTRVITYASGGSSETLRSDNSIAVKAGDVNAVYRLIKEGQ